MTKILFSFFALVSVVVFLVISKTVSKPASEASRQLNDIIDGINKKQGNLTQRITVSSRVSYRMELTILSFSYRMLCKKYESSQK